MEPITIVFLFLALFGAYVGVWQVRKWLREHREKERDKEDLQETIRQEFEKYRRDSGQMALYTDGLAEMPDHRRLSLLQQGLAAQREYRIPEAIDFFRECLGQGVTKSQRIALLLLIGSGFFTNRPTGGSAGELY